MKGIESLNVERGLTIELTAINQYFIQAKMCRTELANWACVLRRSDGRQPLRN